MARTVKDLEAFLVACNRTFETSEGGTIVLAPTGDGLPVVVVRADDPVVFSVEVGPAPKSDRVQARLFRKLLELNANDLLYAAYGLRGDNIVLSSAHELANLDLNEVEAILT